MHPPLMRFLPPHPQGAFGAKRKHDIHTGVDLYCDPDEPVRAMEDGVVIDIAWFTGPFAGSPWWYDTTAIVVHGASGFIVYGEVHKAPGLSIGDRVTEGQEIARVLRVLKNDKGLPTTMLHVELYSEFKRGAKFADWFHWHIEKPKHLLDPTPLLRSAGIQI